MNARVVGIGAVTGYGDGRNVLWDGVMSGLSAARDGAVRIPGDRSYAQLLEQAVMEALSDARQRGWSPGRTGVIAASVLGDLAIVDAVCSGAKPRAVHETVAICPSTVLSKIMSDNGFHGPVMTVQAMCTSGVAALLMAKSWLDEGRVDDVIVVGADVSARSEVIRVFAGLGVAIESVDDCRPFQVGSRGFVFGEAVVALVVTGQEVGGHCGEILGGSMTHDGYHATHIGPNELRRCVREALIDADVDGRRIAYVNAHGPGTRQCDDAEADVVRELVPHAGVYSLKPLVGHCQAAAATVEIAAALLGVEYGIVAAPYRIAHCRSPIRLLDGPEEAESGLILKTSVGLGGHNAAVVLRPNWESRTHRWELPDTGRLLRRDAPVNPVSRAAGAGGQGLQARHGVRRSGHRGAESFRAAPEWRIGRLASD